MIVIRKGGKSFVALGPLLFCVLIFILWGSKNELYYIYTKMLETEEQLAAEHLPAKH